MLLRAKRSILRAGHDLAVLQAEVANRKILEFLREP